MADHRLHELELSRRALNACIAHGVTTVERFMALDPAAVAKWPKVGKRTVAEIRQVQHSLSPEGILEDNYVRANALLQEAIFIVECTPALALSFQWGALDSMPLVRIVRRGESENDD